MKITTEQRRKISNIAKQFRLKMVLLFGSAATGKGEHAGSDVDIAVLCEGTPPGFSTRAELIHRLQKMFPEREVDLSVVNHADPLFLKKITDACQVLYGDPRRFQELKIYAYKRFQDHQRYFQMEQAYVDRFVKSAALAE